MYIVSAHYEKALSVQPLPFTYALRAFKDVWKEALLGKTGESLRLWFWRGLMYMWRG